MRVLALAPGLATQRARTLRRDATPAETRLWSALRARRVEGLRVKRQVPFGPYILDFAIPALTIVIELDGETHTTPYGRARDERRDAYMTAYGWQVLRFTNSDVASNLDGVLAAIVQCARQRPPSPQPSPASGRGGRPAPLAP